MRVCNYVPDPLTYLPTDIGITFVFVLWCFAINITNFSDNTLDNIVWLLCQCVVLFVLQLFVIYSRLDFIYSTVFFEILCLIESYHLDRIIMRMYYFLKPFTELRLKSGFINLFHAFNKIKIEMCKETTT